MAHWLKGLMGKERIMGDVKKLLLGLTLCAALLQSGCASMRTPQYATEAEAVSALGTPTERRDNGDGTATLVFATQPKGSTCMMVRVDAEGKVLQTRDALGRDSLSRVRPGMSKDDVTAQLGPHRSERKDENTGEEVWDWNIRHRGRGSATLFNVYFVDGAVKYVDRSRVYNTPNGERVVRYPYYYYAYPPYPYPYYPYAYPYYWGYPYGGYYNHNRGYHHHGHGGGSVIPRPPPPPRPPLPPPPPRIPVPAPWRR
ncbi:MAG: outer membrane protein assembly factor BamE [Azoarcus sp.]|jgi:uncharacterized protein YceK|nr:outer membrane protein assembly factor BamE [Azoarcus sp.]